MKLDVYKVDLKLSDKGLTMNSAGIDSRVIAKARRGIEATPPAVKRIADLLDCRPEDITVREVQP